jgi:hypothetical protein
MSENKFHFTPMVRLDYSFPDVNDAQRRKIYDILFDVGLKTFRGGGGDGSTNSGVVYISASEVEGLRQRLSEAGLVEEDSNL